jgi:hypothetical protein
MQDVGTMPAQGKVSLRGNQIRMLVAAAIGLPAVVRAFQLLEIMPTELAPYWMMAPLFFTIWVVACAGRNKWLEFGGWAALAIACYYVFEASFALALRP